MVILTVLNLRLDCSVGILVMVFDTCTCTTVFDCTKDIVYRIV